MTFDYAGKTSGQPTTAIPSAAAFDAQMKKASKKWLTYIARKFTKISHDFFLALSFCYFFSISLSMSFFFFNYFSNWLSCDSTIAFFFAASLTADVLPDVLIFVLAGDVLVVVVFDLGSAVFDCLLSYNFAYSANLYFSASPMTILLPFPNFLFLTPSASESFSHSIFFRTGCLFCVDCEVFDFSLFSLINYFVCFTIS